MLETKNLREKGTAMCRAAAADWLAGRVSDATHHAIWVTCIV
jgi:hypothetical protein